MKLYITALALAAPISALSFFDDFDGSALAGHWDFFSEGSSWEHTVSGGLLTVNRLFGPFEFNEIGLVANVGAFTDFSATARVAWDGGAHQEIAFGVSEEFPFMNPRLGTMEYHASPAGGMGVSVFLSGGGGSSHAAPGPGFHDFTITREGSTLSAFLDGALLQTTAVGGTENMQKVFLAFGGPDSANFGQLQVDFVNVVPEPASLVAVALGSLVIARRRSALKR